MAECSAQTGAGQHWEGRKSSKSSLSLVARLGKHPALLHPRPVTSACNTATGCAMREYPAVCPSASFHQGQPATAFGSGWVFFKFPQWHRGSRIITGLLPISAAPGQCLLDVLPSPAPLHQAPLGSSSLSLPNIPYLFSSPPSSLRGFPMEAFREMQPPSVPPLLQRHSPLLGDTCLLGCC